MDSVAPHALARDPDALADLVYEAALVPERWPGVLEALTGIAGGGGAILFASDDMADLRWIATPSLEGLVADMLTGDWVARNERTPRVLGLRHAGFILEEDVYTPAEIESDVIIRDFLRPRGFGWGTATAFPMPTGDTLVLSVERRFADGPVPRAAVAVLDRLRPHLGRAALLSARLKLERAQAAVATLALLGLPAAILSRRAGVLGANDLLEALTPRVVLDRRSRIRFADRGADALLTQALDAGVARAARSIPIAAAGAHPAMIAHLVPMRGSAQDIFAGAAALMVMTPVVPARVPGAELLQGLFDLSAAEARIARGIAGGRTLAELADRGGVSVTTVRTQIKAVFGKTGVARQVDLVRLLSGLSLGP